MEPFRIRVVFSMKRDLTVPVFLRISVINMFAKDNPPLKREVVTCNCNPVPIITSN